MYRIISIFIIFILLVNKVVYGQNFIPGPRIGQRSLVMGDKIYYTGGYAPLKNLFYLELNKNWVEVLLTGEIKMLPTKFLHAAGIGGVDQDIIFMFGGKLEMEGNVFQLDTKTNTLSFSRVQGTIPPPRGFLNSVSYKGKIYIFGGGMLNDTVYNGLDILDTINMRWEVGSLTNAPL